MECHYDLTIFIVASLPIFTSVNSKQVAALSTVIALVIVLVEHKLMLSKATNNKIISKKKKKNLVNYHLYEKKKS